MDKIPKYGTADWRFYQYTQAKKANIGHNYQYLNDIEWLRLENIGWEMYVFNIGYMQYGTSSELEAKEIVIKLKSENNFARIIAGQYKTKQRQKIFSVIYKSKTSTK